MVRTWSAPCPRRPGWPRWSRCWAWPPTWGWVADRARDPHLPGAVDLARRAGLTEFELSDLYYLTLLRMLGCTVASDYHADLFGDEVAFGRGTQHLDYGDGAAFGQWVMESFAADQPAAVRGRMIEKLFTYTPERRPANILGHCEVDRMLATGLRLPEPVVHGIGLAFERWDGTGVPTGWPARTCRSPSG